MTESVPGTAPLLLLFGLALAAPAAAQETPADTVEVRPAEPIPVDTLGILDLAPADTVPLLGPRFQERGGHDELAGVPSLDEQPINPRNAAIRAFLIPGWGQFHTGHPLRGVAFAAAEVGFFSLGYLRQQDALDLREEIRDARAAFFADPPEGAPEDSLALEDLFQSTDAFVQTNAELEDARERRNDWYAYGALSVIFAAVDAYASAQLDPIEVGADAAVRRVWAGVRLPVGERPDRGRR